MEHFRNAVDLFRQLDRTVGGYKRAVLDSMIGIGQVHYNLGDYREALSCYDEVLRAAEKNGDRSCQHAVLNDMGLVYMDQADFRTATELFTRSSIIANQLGDREAKAIAICNLGVVNERQERFTRAGERFNECLRVAQEIPAPKLEIPALEGLATVALRARRYDEALRNYDKANEIAVKLGDKLRQSELAWCKAGTYHDLGNYGKAIELAARAGELADELHEANYSYLALTASGKSHLALGQFEAARANLDRAIEKVEQIRSRIGGREQQRAFFFERKIEPYYLMVDLLIRQNRPEEALEFAERARSRTLLDLTGKVKFDIAKAMSLEEKQEEQRLDGHLTDFNSRLYREYQQKEPDSNRIADLKARLDKARADYDSFMDRLFVSHPDLRIDRAQAASFSIKDTGIVLPSPDAVVLEFEVMDDKVYVFILTLGDDGRTQVRAYPISISRKSLTTKVDDFRFRIANNSLGIDTLSTELFQRLLGSAAGLLKGKKTVVLVPDDVLWDMPFQALKDNGGRYMIENYTLIYAPSLAVLREMRRRKAADSATNVAPSLAAARGPGSELTFLAFGDPALSSKTIHSLRTIDRDAALGPLPAAKMEVQTLGTMYGSSRSAVFVGAEATEERAKAEMGRFRILHFATHGILDGTNPMYSHVVLSQSKSGTGEDGLLEAREIMRMHLEADLAILSACQTGRGRISRGEGVIGMSWALFVAGCSTSVVSQWNVESNSTARLMIEFHRALAVR